MEWNGEPPDSLFEKRGWWFLHVGARFGALTHFSTKLEIIAGSPLGYPPVS
jgi:hypothetical protein